MTPPRLSPAEHDWLADARLQKVLSALAAKGGKARIVGGAVRNALLGEPVDDIDIASTNTPDQVMELCRRAGLRCLPTGVDHGTVTVLAGSADETRTFEVTTLRRDVATYGRHADVAFTDDWAADAARRDFTINALYCDGDGEVFDPLGGLADIEARRVRFVGEPVARIREDYLRILRFFRFSARYAAHGHLEPEGFAACIAEQAGLARLSAERIRQEWMKLAKAPQAAPVIAEMVASGIAARLLDEPLYPDRLARLAAIEAKLRRAPDSLLRTVALTGTGGDIAGRLRPRLRLTNQETERLRRLAIAGPVTPGFRPAERRAILYRNGSATWRDAVVVSWAEKGAPPDDPDWTSLYRLAEEWPVPTFPLRGAHLLERGIPAGRELGQLLQELEDWWIATDFTLGAEALLAKLADWRPRR